MWYQGQIRIRTYLVVIWWRQTARTSKQTFRHYTCQYACLLVYKSCIIPWCCWQGNIISDYSYIYLRVLSSVLLSEWLSKWLRRLDTAPSHRLRECTGGESGGALLNEHTALTGNVDDAIICWHSSHCHMVYISAYSSKDMMYILQQGDIW